MIIFRFESLHFALYLLWTLNAPIEEEQVEKLINSIILCNTAYIQDTDALQTIIDHNEKLKNSSVKKFYSDCESAQSYNFFIITYCNYLNLNTFDDVMSKFGKFIQTESLTHLRIYLENFETFEKINDNISDRICLFLNHYNEHKKLQEEKLDLNEKFFDLNSNFNNVDSQCLLFCDKTLDFNILETFFVIFKNMYGKIELETQNLSTDLNNSGENSWLQSKNHAIFCLKKAKNHRYSNFIEFCLNIKPANISYNCFHFLNIESEVIKNMEKNESIDNIENVGDHKKVKNKILTYNYKKFKNNIFIFTKEISCNFDECLFRINFCALNQKTDKILYINNTFLNDFANLMSDNKYVVLRFEVFYNFYQDISKFYVDLFYRAKQDFSITSNMTTFDLNGAELYVFNSTIYPVEEATLENNLAFVENCFLLEFKKNLSLYYDINISKIYYNMFYSSLSAIDATHLSVIFNKSNSIYNEKMDSKCLIKSLKSFFTSLNTQEFNSYRFKFDVVDLDCYINYYDLLGNSKKRNEYIESKFMEVLFYNMSNLKTYEVKQENPMENFKFLGINVFYIQKIINGINYSYYFTISFLPDLFINNEKFFNFIISILSNQENFKTDHQNIEILNKNPPIPTGFQSKDSTNHLTDDFYTIKNKIETFLKSQYKCFRVKNTSRNQTLFEDNPCFHFIYKTSDFPTFFLLVFEKDLYNFFFEFLYFDYFLPVIQSYLS